MPFLTPTWAVESTGEPGWYRLTRPLVYQGKDETFTVGVGAKTDNGSIPRLLTWLVPRDSVSTPDYILHDELCRLAAQGRLSRRDADGILRRLLREAGVDPVTRWVVWAGVRVGGSMRDATSKEWVQVVGISAVMVPVLVVPVTSAGVVWVLFTAAGRIAEWWA